MRKSSYKQLCLHSHSFQDSRGHTTYTNDTVENLKKKYGQSMPSCLCGQRR